MHSRYYSKERRMPAFPIPALASWSLRPHSERHAAGGPAAHHAAGRGRWSSSVNSFAHDAAFQHHILFFVRQGQNGIGNAVDGGGLGGNSGRGTRLLQRLQ